MKRCRPMMQIHALVADDDAGDDADEHRELRDLRRAQKRTSCVRFADFVGEPCFRRTLVNVQPMPQITCASNTVAKYGSTPR